MSERPIYTIHNLVHRYQEDGPAVLRIDDLTIDRGRIVGLVGPNGSGKSTLLAILAQVVKPTSGKVALDNGAEFGSPENRRRVTLLLQKPFLLRRTVTDNVTFGLKARGGNGRMAEEVAEALDWVGLPPDEFAHRPAWKLSGGEAQRAALAARLILRPEVLLLDEPTASVDAESTRLIRSAALRAREEWGSTLVIVSHDSAWLGRVADETVNLHRGRMAGHGTVNIIARHWQLTDNGLCCLDTGDGQIICALPPGRGDRVAVLEPEAILMHLIEPDPVPNRNVIKGRIERLTLEDDQGRVYASVTVDRLRLRAFLPPDLTPRPGAEVWLSFDHSAIRWT